MKTNLNTSTKHNESTYALLVRSEEKERNLFEAAIYALLIFCAVFSVWQVAHQPITVPARIGVASTDVAVTFQAPVDARS